LSYALKEIDYVGKWMTPKQQVRELIESLLVAAGWHICDADSDK
jgi:hypothetical protein